MDEREFNKRREALTFDLSNTFNAAVQADPALTANGPISPEFGEIKLHNFVCAYTDNPFINVLDIWFGRHGGRANHPGEDQFEADVINSQWVNHGNQQERFSNRQLVDHCITRLRQSAGEQ